MNNILPPFRIPGPSAREGKDYGDTMTLCGQGYRGTIGQTAYVAALVLAGALLCDWVTGSCLSGRLAATQAPG